MHRSRATIIAAGLLGSLPAIGADVITIDGRLDEAEWATAKVYTDFRITEPLTGDVPPYRTELRLLARPDGLYFGARSEIPRDQRTHGRSQRDAESLDADPIILFVDFEGRGRTAYEFTISMSGTQRDSVVLNQTTNSRDWDAVWFAAVTEDDTGWTAEFRIPWSVAPEGIVNGDKRTIGFYASRYIKKTSTRYAVPGVELFKPTFVQEFQRVEVPRFKTSSLDVVPYVAATTDFLDSSTALRGGLDVTWKPNGANQLTATLKPDFGQVESDDLVVNFSAIETFFSDKRPFFTEGIQLFDLRMPVNGRLVNTRRVGGAPDVGPEGATDVLAGAKYTGGNGASEYGVFAALEEDSSEADGRQFVAARFHRKFDSMSVGYLGTFVDHPTIDRDAQVHAVDFDATFGKGFILNAQAIATDISDPALATESPANDGKGFGAWTTLQYQPGGAWQEALRPHLVRPRFQRQRLRLYRAGESPPAQFRDLLLHAQLSGHERARDHELVPQLEPALQRSRRSAAGERRARLLLAVQERRLHLHELLRRILGTRRPPDARQRQCAAGRPQHLLFGISEGSDRAVPVHGQGDHLSGRDQRLVSRDYRQPEVFCDRDA